MLYTTTYDILKAKNLVCRVVLDGVAIIPCGRAVGEVMTLFPLLCGRTLQGGHNCRKKGALGALAAAAAVLTCCSS